MDFYLLPVEPWLVLTLLWFVGTPLLMAFIFYVCRRCD
jgi:hypothetical protein